jgi:hypothetical protein
MKVRGDLSIHAAICCFIPRSDASRSRVFSARVDARIDIMPCQVPNASPPAMIGMASCTFDMGGHVVIAFVCVPIAPRLLRRNAFKECLQIGANVPRRILLNEQSR